MKMIFNELYLFSPHEKKAKKIEFTDGINILTSSQLDGNEKGKSVIMRSLYHSLGAEAWFSNKWEKKNKIYILHFTIDDIDYYIYRSANLYKIFDTNKKIIFTATHSAELAEKLKTIINFAVMLPSRNENKLEITPPAFNYLPYFLDQDKYDGSAFVSFDKLGQYANYKENVLFCHFGVYNDEYFYLVQRKEELTEQIQDSIKRSNLLLEMIKDVDNKLEVGSYSGNLESLNHDIDRYRKEYSSLIIQLNKSKKHLVELRNNLFDLETLLEETKQFMSSNETEIKQLLKHICPECGTEITDTINLRSKRYNISDNIIIVKNDLQISIQKILSDIEKEENKYSALLERMEEYECKMQINTKAVNDILRYKGLCEIRESIVDENHQLQCEIDTQRAALDKIQKSITEYNNKRRAIDDKYYELLMNAKVRFGLDEIDPEKAKTISNNLKIGGSNRYISTVIWYFTIIRLRNEFNPDAIQFPIVLDSPNNAETDELKENNFIEYMLSNSDLSSQFIMSGIGFNRNEFVKMTDKPINIIMLNNEKYHLLQEEDYNKYSYLMNELCDAEM